MIPAATAGGPRGEGGQGDEKGHSAVPPPPRLHGECFALLSLALRLLGPGALLVELRRAAPSPPMLTIDEERRVATLLREQSTAAHLGAPVAPVAPDAAGAAGAPVGRPAATTAVAERACTTCAHSLLASARGGGAGRAAAQAAARRAEAAAARRARQLARPRTSFRPVRWRSSVVAEPAGVRHHLRWLPAASAVSLGGCVKHHRTRIALHSPAALPRCSTCVPRQAAH